MGKLDNQPAAEKNMIKPYKEEKPYDLALLDRRPDDLAALGNCTPFCHFVSVCVILVPRQVFSILMDIIERTPYRFHLRFVFKSLLIT